MPRVHTWPCNVDPRRSRTEVAIILLLVLLAACVAAADSDMALSLDSRVKLRRGTEMPLFGLGTWLSEGDGTCHAAVRVALEHGYNLIDTATMYKNEHDVGAAVRESGKRPFIVSKLAPEDHGREKTLAALDRTLADLGVDVLDLWLMHSPSGGSVVETWQTMLECRDAGKVRAVGVSNTGPAQLEGLKAAGLEAPEVDQFELHVWNQQKEAVAYCRANGILVMSYCPLARCKLFGSTALAKLAEDAGRSEAQLCIRWLLQSGFVTIPKSTSTARIQANADVFDWSLTPEQMAQMDALDQTFFASNAVKAMWTPWEEVR